MKLKDVCLCPDLDCNEVYMDNGQGCPRCLSPEGIHLSLVLVKIEELSKLVYRQCMTKMSPIKNGKLI